MSRRAPSAWLRPETLQHFALLAAGIASVFMVRSLWTYPAEDSDALQKYYYAAEILRSGDWSLLLTNHHTTRWVEMLPQVFVTAAWRMRYEAFYILPLLVFSAYYVLILRVMKRWLNTSRLVLLGALLFVEPLAFRTSSELLNPPFGVLFAFAGVFALTRKSTLRPLTVIVAAALFFCAYGAHATYLAFAGGALLWLLCFRRQWSAATLFTGSLVVLLAIEWLVFNGLSNGRLSFGRWEILANSKHMWALGSVFEPVTFGELFTRWVKLPPFDIVLALGFFGGALLVALRPSLRRQMPDLVACVFMAGLAYALSVTLAVVDFDPLRPALPLMARYLTVFFPFAIVFVVWLGAHLTGPPTFRSDMRTELVAGLLLLALVAAPHTFNRPVEWAVKIRPVAFFWRAEKETLHFAHLFRRGEALIYGRARHGLKLVPMYRFPLRVIDRDGRVSVPDPKADARCVRRLDRVPLHDNLVDCP